MRDDEFSKWQERLLMRDDEFSKWRERLLLVASPGDWSPPAEFIEKAEELQPQLRFVRARLEQLLVDSNTAAYLALHEHTFASLQTNFAPTRLLIAPTPEELSLAEETLREHVLAEVSDQELEQAVAEIPDDPEKLKLVAFLTDALKQAVSTREKRWLAFVLVFWLAMRMKPEVVGALALAFAVMCLVKPDD